MTEALPTIAIIAIGVFVAFWGYKFFRASVTLVGAVVGYMVGKAVFEFVAPAFGLDNNMNYQLIGIGIFVVAFGGLAFYFYLKAIIAICTLLIGYKFYVGYAAFGMLVENPVANHVLITVIGGLIGVVTGLAVYYIQKWAIMIATAYIGAQLICSVVVPFLTAFAPICYLADKLRGWIFPGSFITSSVVVSGLMLIILTVASFTYQFTTQD